MKGIIRSLTLFVSILLFVSFSFTGISVSADKSTEIEALKQKITELEKRIKDLENILKIYSGSMESKSEDIQGWLDKKSWRTLKKGMSRDEVKKILGEPVKTVDGFRTIWYYPSFYRGYVSFDEEGNLTGWIEP